MRRDGVAFWGTSHVQQMGGVRSCIHHHAAANALPTIHIDSTPKGLYVQSRHACTPAGRGTGPRGAEWRVFMGGGTVVAQPRRFGCSGSLAASD
jgi:hypothetical protein